LRHLDNARLALIQRRTEQSRMMLAEGSKQGALGLSDVNSNL
jgi:hypothetical protein